MHEYGDGTKMSRIGQGLWVYYRVGLIHTPLSQISSYLSRNKLFHILKCLPSADGCMMLCLEVIGGSINFSMQLAFSLKWWCGFDQ